GFQGAARCVKLRVAALEPACHGDISNGFAPAPTGGSEGM
ncbi:MAG: hypothetical protein AVDCRST_MAG90-2157, partial [uncultured Microvirga sp.]